MIICLLSDRYSHLFDDCDHIVKIYYKWQMDIRDFIKQEYANILSLRPDKILIEENAVSDPEKISLMKEIFPDITIVFLASKEPKEDQDAIGDIMLRPEENMKETLFSALFPDSEKKGTVTEQGPVSVKEAAKKQNIKIGIITDDEKNRDPVYLVSFNIISYLMRFTDDICCIEAGRQSYIQDLAYKKWVKEDGDICFYQGIPVFHNAVKEDARYSVFVFQPEVKRMWEQCDHPVFVHVHKKNKTIALELRDGETYILDDIEDPCSLKNMDTYEKLFGMKLENKESENRMSSERSRKKSKEKKAEKTAPKKYKKKMVFVLLAGIIFFACGVLGYGALQSGEDTTESRVSIQNTSHTAASEEDVQKDTEKTTEAEKTTEKKEDDKKEKKADSAKSTSGSAGTTGSTAKKETKRSGTKTTESTAKKTTAGKKKTTKKSVTGKKKSTEKSSTAAKKKTTTAVPATESKFDMDYQVD